MLARFTFRVASLALKFALTIIIARTLGFAAVADYGLAVAVSVVSSKLLGLGFSTEISRRLSAENPSRAIHDARRLLVLYCVVYAAIAIVLIVVYVTGGFDAFPRITRSVLCGVMLVAFSEHAGLETTSYVFSLHQPRAGAVLLFVRTGAWAGVAIVSLLAGLVHSIETILAFWWGANIIAAVAAYRCIQCRGREIVSEQRTQTVRTPGSTRSVWMDGLPFFIATNVLAGLQYGERFLASGVISTDSLGRYVFVWSVSNSIQTIAYATIVVTAAPRLVRSLSVAGGDFWATLRRAVRSGVAITSLAAVSILITHKLIFRMAHEPGGSRELTMLVILLVSFVLRSIADVYWVGAVALRLGKQVATAIACVAALVIPVEWMLITRLEAMGAALSHLTASVAIVAVSVFITKRTRVANVAAVREREAAHVS
ncbi:lipopolysaccharide biosynthesis protein [Paraburkholderia sediminicola]|uniref:lipopolysaccharide biosynthesis protein n=1 Tax=Paraburkholderia sediminicola TaxID=458836 RepID=UPI0038BB3A54